MRLVDVITNLKNHDFDISNYPLCKAEADVFFKCAEEIEKCKNSYNEDKLDDYKNRVIGIDLNHAESEGRYKKYRNKRIKGFSSAYLNACDLELVPNLDGTWLTIQDNVGTSMTIKLSDLSDFICLNKGVDKVESEE